MSTPKVLYIAGERQHAGKTVSSLGIISSICNHIDPSDIGYFKPVGQEMVKLPNGQRIDKDVRVVQEFTDLHMPDLEILSPVRVVDGVTKSYIASDNPQERTKQFEASVAKTMDHFSDKKLIIAEGTGHPGVGSVIGMSNARVANLLEAKIMYLVGGGIGRTLDELEVDLSYFKYKQNRLAGILFNKVLATKVDSMRDVINEKSLSRIFPEWTPDLNIFGYLPQVPYLNNPSMQLIQKSFKNHTTIKGYCGKAWHRSCRKVKIVSQGSDIFRANSHLRPMDIAMIGAGSQPRLTRIIQYNDSLPTDEKLGGIILTCADSDMPNETMIKRLAESGIPTIMVQQDTAEADAVLYKTFTNTKLQLYDKQKHKKITNLFDEHFDIQNFIKVMGL